MGMYLHTGNSLFFFSNVRTVCFSLQVSVRDVTDNREAPLKIPDLFEKSFLTTIHHGIPNPLLVVTGPNFMFN